MTPDLTPCVPSFPQAYEWFSIAEALQCAERPPFEQLAECLGARAVATAERRAQRWLKAHSDSCLLYTSPSPRD